MATEDPKWFEPANLFGHLNGAGKIHVHAQFSVEPGKSRHKVVPSVHEPDVQTW